MLHEQVVVVTGRTADVPHIPRDQRPRVDHLGDPADGIVHIGADFGFRERTDVHRRAAALDVQASKSTSSRAGRFFVSAPALR